MPSNQDNKNTNEIAVFAGGCFWCTEAVFESLRGVISVKSGYTGGNTKNPKYEEVATDTTGHAESIEIVFDPSVISYRDLLTVFFNTHDPTSLNRQGNDVGRDYRSAIFYTSQEQKDIAHVIIKELEDSHSYDKPIVTEVVPLSEFYEAEELHQDYYRNNPTEPYCEIVIAPKMEKFQKRFSELLKTAETKSNTKI